MKKRKLTHDSGIAGIRTERDEIQAKFKEINDQLSEMTKSHKKLKTDHYQLKADFRKTCTHRARILASQILLEFLGEQPNKTRPCRYFSDLRASHIMCKMLRAAFPEVGRNDKKVEDLLKNFDYLIEGRNQNVHPSFDAILMDEMKDLVEFLEREDNRRRLSLGQFTSLRVLKARGEIARCRSFPLGSKHADRLKM
jgi:hypothetical protein